MKLTTKGNYAIAAILDLAINSKKGHISLKEIANRLELSENYLRQLFMELRKKEIVDSVRGVGGGYFLSHHPSEISLLDIIEAVEGEVFIVPCLDEECNEDCVRSSECIAKDLWAKLNDSVKEKMSNYTLEELMNEYEEKEE